jgi:transcriptional regulator with XRE-family HTH domain
MSGIAVISSGRYVATNLADVIEAQGRRRNWLAERVGVSEALLYKIVSGTKTADRALGERIADALGVPFGVLFEIRERNDSDSPPEEPA